MFGNKRHSEKEASAYLVYNDPHSQQKQTLEVCSRSEFVIGRATSSDIIIKNPAVSRNHCVIKKDENGDWILHGKSSSGVYVNKELVPQGESRRLCDWDIISVTGPSNYPFCFYTDETCHKKRRKMTDDTLSDINNRNKGRKETNLKEEINSATLSSSEHDDHNSCTVDVSIDGKSIIDDKVLNGDKANPVVKEDGKNEENTSSLRSNLKKIMDEKFILKEQILKSVEAYSKNLLNLNLEMKMAEFHNILSNEKIQNLTCELAEMKLSLLKKDNELKRNEEILILTEHRVKEKDSQNGGMLKLHKDMIEFIENELQCAVCNEIIIDATVMNCPHFLCNLCINEWMKKQKNCPICRTKVEDVIKSPPINSFIDKALQRVYSPELLEARNEIIEARKEQKKGKNRKQRQTRKYREEQSNSTPELH